MWDCVINVLEIMLIFSLKRMKSKIFHGKISHMVNRLRGIGIRINRI